jgi:hypothetical protein
VIFSKAIKWGWYNDENISPSLLDAHCTPSTKIFWRTEENTFLRLGLNIYQTNQCSKSLFEREHFYQCEIIKKGANIPKVLTDMRSNFLITISSIRDVIFSKAIKWGWYNDENISPSLLDAHCTPSTKIFWRTEENTFLRLGLNIYQTNQCRKSLFEREHFYQCEIIKKGANIPKFSRVKELWRNRGRGVT